VIQERSRRIRAWLTEPAADVPTYAIDGAAWLCLSAYAYNELDDYEQLAEVVASVLRKDASE
jgi:isopenicillin-N epimerase